MGGEIFLFSFSKAKVCFGPSAEFYLVEKAIGFEGRSQQEIR